MTIRNRLTTIVIAAFATLTGCAELVAGTNGPDTASPDAAVDSGPVTPPPMRTGDVRIQCAPPEDTVVLTNSIGFAARRISITSADRPIEVMAAQLNLEAPNTCSRPGCTITGHLATDAGEAYFREFRLRNHATGQIVMGPASLNGTRLERSQGAVNLRDAFTLHAGETLNLDALLDIAAHEQWIEDLVRNPYQLLLHAGTSIRYTDTDEAVPADHIQVDPRCESPTETDRFVVRARFADLIPDLNDIRPEGLPRVTEFHVPNPDVLFPVLRFLVVNDGFEAGLVTHALATAFVETDLGERVPFNAVASGCVVKNDNVPDFGRDITYAEATGVSGNHLEFFPREMRVEGSPLHSDFYAQDYRVMCHLAWPAGVNGTSIRIQMGMTYDQFTMSSTGDEGRIEGTLVLDENSLPALRDSAHTVIISR